MIVRTLCPSSCVLMIIPLLSPSVVSLSSRFGFCILGHLQGVAHLRLVLASNSFATVASGQCVRVKSYNCVENCDKYFCPSDNDVPNTATPTNPSVPTMAALTQSSTTTALYHVHRHSKLLFHIFSTWVFVYLAIYQWHLSWHCPAL